MLRKSSKAAIDAVDRLKRTLGVDDDLVGIGIGLPGRVDPESGMVRHAVNLGIGDEPWDIMHRVQDEHGVPVFLENDVNAAAFGAYELVRQDHAVESLAYVSVGTGIGAGVVLGGAIHRGFHGVAGEIGHFPTVAHGRVCACGRVGCLETVASGRAIERAWPRKGTSSSTRDLFASAAASDKVAQKAVCQLGDQLALAIYLLTITFDPEATVVGGGVADAGAQFLHTIQMGIKRLAAQSDFAASLELGARVTLSPHADIGAIGAAAVAQHGLKRLSRMNS